MSKLANAFIIGFISFLFLVAIFWYAVEVGQNQGVTVEGLQAEWGSVDQETTVIDASIRFKNPHAFQVQVLRLEYAFTVNDNRVGGGFIDREIRLEPGSERDVEFSIQVPSSFVADWWQAHALAGEETTLAIQGEASVKVSADTQVLPFESKADWTDDWVESWTGALETCPRPEPQPCVSEASYEWKRGSGGLLLQSSFDVHNPNDAAMEIRNGSFRLLLGGNLVSEGHFTETVTIPAEQSRVVRIDSPFAASGLVAWWPSHVAGCERSRADVSLSLSYALQEQPASSGNNTTQEPGYGPVQEPAVWEVRIPNLETRFLCDN